jgi:hypothetical protein
MKTLTMRGKQIDMARLVALNSHTVALGNASMNARGDIVGEGGKIIKPREEIAREYHKGNPRTVRQVALRDIADEAFITPEQMWEQVKDHVNTQQASAMEEDTVQTKHRSKRNLSDE